MKRGSSIRVLLADEHQVIRESLTAMLSVTEHVQVVGQAANMATAIHLARKLNPDVILLDIRMPGSNGLDAYRVLASQVPGSRIIMLTSFEDEDYLFTALQAGASGYLLKTASPEEIAGAIEDVVEGKRSLSNPLLEKLVSRYTNLSYRVESLESGCSQE